MATPWNLEIHSHIYKGGASKGALRIGCITEISSATNALEHMRIHNLQFSILRFLKHSIFPRLEGHNPSAKKKGGGGGGGGHY